MGHRICKDSFADSELCPPEPETEANIDDDLSLWPENELLESEDEEMSDSVAEEEAAVDYMSLMGVAPKPDASVPGAGVEPATPLRA